MIRIIIQNISLLDYKTPFIEMERYKFERKLKIYINTLSDQNERRQEN
jgi:hypothetical protein